jgi:hypothetical protein
MNALMSLSPMLLLIIIAILLLLTVFFIDAKIDNSCITIMVRASFVVLVLILLYSFLFK